MLVTLCEDGTAGSDCTPPFSADVSAAAARWLEYLAVASLAPMVVVAPMMTAFSNKYGRKLFLLLPLGGVLLQYFVAMVVVRFRLDLRVLFVGSFANGFMGNIYAGPAYHSPGRPATACS